MTGLDLSEHDLAAGLRAAYGLGVRSVRALDGGADVDARAYRVVSDDGGLDYFLKVRRAGPGAASVAIPHFLNALGIRQVLAPIPTHRAELVAELDGHTLVLYPFQPGRDAMAVGLTPAQWTELGLALKAVHSARLPERLLPLLPHEVYSPEFRSRTRGYLQRALAGVYDQGAGARLAEVLRSRRAEIDFMLGRAEQLAGALVKGAPRPLVVCHADLHKWNIQVGPAGELLIVDWDSLRLAPKECDLMFIGGNIGGDPPGGYAAEEASFYRGYSETRVDPVALAYYRYERILTDVAEYSQQVWDRPGMTVDACARIASLIAFNFLPGNELDAARRADRALR